MLLVHAPPVCQDDAVLVDLCGKPAGTLIVWGEPNVVAAL